MSPSTSTTLLLLSAFIAATITPALCRGNDPLYVGTNTGSAWDDNQDGNWRAKTIKIYHDDQINGIQAKYMSRRPKYSQKSLHGSNTGTLSTINLGNNEHITEVHGVAGDVVYQLTFVTNQNTYGPYGADNVNGSAFSVVAGDGWAINSFAGYVDTTLTSLGFLVFNEWYNGASGSTAAGWLGTAYDVTYDDNKDSSWVPKDITLYYDDNRVNGLQVDYRTIDLTSTDAGALMGEAKGTQVVIQLADDEDIVAVGGSSGDVIDSLYFTTSAGTVYGPYGPGSSETFHFPIAEQWVLGSITGTGYSVVESLVNTDAFPPVYTTNNFAMLSYLNFEAVKP